MSRRERSESQLNQDALVRRDTQFRSVYERSVTERDHRASSRPRALGPLLGWYRREWDAEFPTRLHERGIEPDSQLGAPRLSGALRHRFAMIDPDPSISQEVRAARATDYDKAKDTWSTGSAPLFPIHDALSRLRETKPLIAGSLEKLAYGGFDVYRHGDARGWEHYQTETYMRAEIELLWMIWSRGQQDAGREVA